jgi:hypothetical protein
MAARTTELSQALINALTTWFVRADRPLTAWTNAASSFASIPMLRGLWLMNSVDENSLVYDASHQGRALTYNGMGTFSSYLLAPVIDFRGTDDYLSRTDEAGLDLIGDETCVPAYHLGITTGGWFCFDRVTNNEGLITKGTDGSPVNSNFKLSFRGDIADKARFAVHNGGNIYLVDSSAKGGCYIFIPVVLGGGYRCG